MSHVAINPVKPGAVRDVYRFGNGPELVLQPGTMGWSAADFDDPHLRGMWDAGRYEILNGILTIMPAAYFRGGRCALKLLRRAEDYLESHKLTVEASAEVDIQVTVDRLVRADAVAVFADELENFKALEFEVEGADWQDYTLTIPPTLVIESVSKGHEIHDRQTKREWYAEFGVKHYWIVDGFAKSLDCLLLQDGKYVSEAAGSNADELALKSLAGLTIPLKDLWGD